MSGFERTRIAEYISSIDFTHRSRMRGACPVCGREGTFSVTKIDGCLVYRCFSASCGVSGKSQYCLSREEVTSLITPPTPSFKSSFKKPLSWLPATKFADANAKALEWHATSVLPSLYFDVKLKRIVFPLLDQQGVLVGGAGRGVTATIKPKWWVYGQPEVPYVAHKDYSRAVLVEDCFSAAACSSVATGIALLGTTLSEHHLPFLEPYDEIIVALDKDATAKAMKISYRIPNSRVVILERDLKYLTKEEISCII